MYVCYQVATPDVEIRPNVTSYQGDFEKVLSELNKLGYEHVELMTRNPNNLNIDEISRLLQKYNMDVPMVCTGELFGQEGLKLSTDNDQLRAKSIKRTKKMIDFASVLNADINIGRLRGHYEDNIEHEVTYKHAITSFRLLADYAKEKNVGIVLEPVTQLQTNFINSTKEGIDFVKAVNKENFKLMIDIYHSNIEDPDVYEAIHSAKEVLGHIHFADNNRRIPGTCGFDFKKIVQTLHEVNYTGALSIEMFQIPDQYTCAKESINYLKPIIDEVIK